MVQVDLEAHSYRSFQGFVCLMQISTRPGMGAGGAGGVGGDWLVDTLCLRHLIGPKLGPIFANPTIVKVNTGF